jgi:hypothetical protein
MNMFRPNLMSAAALCLVCSSTNAVHAHFKLLTPASWVNEDSSGGPQKGSPCGVGGADDVQPVPMSGKITEYHAGEEIEVTWVDTVAHPGHFRIALAENRADLKDPAIKQDSYCSYDEDMVPKEASGNVLADGVAYRSRMGFSGQAGMMFSQKVTLPNKPCDKCTLQVMQIMENDIQSISNCYYHHCADIKILPAEGGEGGPSAAGSSAVGASAGSSAAGTSAGGASAAGTTSHAGASAAAGGVGGGGTSAAAAGMPAAAAGKPASTPVSTTPASSPSAAAGRPATTTTAGSTAAPAGAAGVGTTANAATTAPPAASSSGGCSVSGVRFERGAPWAIALAFAPLFFVRARRRSR